MAGIRARLDELRLRNWQAEALAAWSASCRGVVEAVTGTGKTLLAVAAIGAVLDRGARVLVLVPTLELQHQWIRVVHTRLPGVRVGALGGGSDDDLFSCRVLVATPHSATGVPLDLPPGTPGLLVADEAHRYGAPTWASALGEAFELRLALTATYERGDEGVADVLEPYFGGVVYRYGYDRAVADGTVAPFGIALGGVALRDHEREAYDTVDSRVRRLHRQLTGPLSMPSEPRALLAAVSAVVARADAAGDQGPLVRTGREYLARLRERREIAAGADAKLEMVGALAAVLATRRSLLFTDTVEQAERAAEVLCARGVRAEAFHGRLRADRRRSRLARFRRGETSTLAAPRVLDEGVDVPDADLAVVLAAFRTRRQLVQRLGRVLRRKPDDREARLVLLHALGTTEDPARGGHAEFLEEVGGVATDLRHLDLRSGTAGLVEWLDGRAGAAGG